MRRAAAALEERGLESVYIHCSGDPDSLDGVIFPAIGTAIVDGTAPHGMDTLGHRCAYLSCSACSSCMRYVSMVLSALPVCSAHWRALSPLARAAHISSSLELSLA